MNCFQRIRCDSMRIGTVLLATLAVAGRNAAQAPHSQAARDGRQAVEPTRESGSLVRFHFDQPVELLLDTDRIAVWAPQGVDPVLPAVFTPGGAEPLGVPGWHLLRLEKPVDVAGLPSLLEGLAPALGCDYVSPVFVDDLGGPLVPTRDLLVQFEPDVETVRAESVLTAGVADEILDREWAGLPRAYRLRSAATSGLDVLARANELAQRRDGHGRSQVLLASGDTNGRTDVFLHDTQAGVTTRVSEGTGGIQSDLNSLSPSLSADGRFVALQSYGTNLDPAANGLGQVYVRDTLLDTLTLVTKTAGGQAANASCHIPSISDDGMRVAFFSPVTNLVPGASGLQAYVCDLGTQTCFLASVDTAGIQGTLGAFRATLSGDGNRVAFWTTDALNPTDTNDLMDLYVRDLVAGTTLAASTDASGAFGARDAFGLQLSTDGRYVVVLTASPLVPGDTNECIDAFRKDLQTQAVVRVSLGTGGRQAKSGSTHPWISPDGGLVGFVSADDRLTSDDALDEESDVYLHTLATGQTVLVTGGS